MYPRSFNAVGKRFKLSSKKKNGLEPLLFMRKKIISTTCEYDVINVTLTRRPGERENRNAYLF